MCVAHLQGSDTYKPASMPSGIISHISWQETGNLLCSLIYVLTLHGYLGAWKCVFPLLLFDALEYNWSYPNSSHWILIWWHLALCLLAKVFSSAALLVLEGVADRKCIFLCCGCLCSFEITWQEMSHRHRLNSLMSSPSQHTQTNMHGMWTLPVEKDLLI